MKRLMVVLAAVAILAGCGKDEAKKPASAANTNETAKTYADLDNDAVIVTVNGKSLTKLDVETDLTLQLSLLRMAMPKIKGERIRKEQDRLIRKSVEGFINRRVMLDEAERRGIVATAEDIDAIHTNFVATAFRGKKMTYEQMCSRLRPAMAKKINADLATDAVVFKLRKLMAKETAYVPTNSEIADKLVKFAEYNKRAHAIEAEAWQTATNAWKRTQSGEPFERTAEWVKGKSDHATYEAEWGSFTMDYFNDSPALQACLRAMKPGMVTPPMAADNGVVLVQLIEIVEPRTPNDSVRYNLSQLHFALPEYYNDYTAETLKVELAREMSNRQLQAKVDALAKAAAITYPNGPTKQLFKKTQKTEEPK